MAEKTAAQPEYVRWLENLDSDDVGEVGGKNASLGEMLQALKAEGIAVPPGFATTAEAYRSYLKHNDLTARIEQKLNELKADNSNIEDVGSQIRDMIDQGEMPPAVYEAIAQAYADLCARFDDEGVDVAVRSSATAEDLPEASFAGQQETFLNIRGTDELLDACGHCFASLFTDRAIAYRQEQGFDHMKVALSVGVQKMVRADEGGAGVAFTIDSESGFPDVVVINANWGLGETVVAGTANPDEYRLFKPLLDESELAPIIEKTLGSKKRKIIYADDGDSPTRQVDVEEDDQNCFVLDDEQIMTLGRWCARIEQHYNKPMDIEWAWDGRENRMYIVQARPETVQSQKQPGQLKTYRLLAEGKRITSGLAIGHAIATGSAMVLQRPDEADKFEDGQVLITSMTDPDWGPLMERASAIVTDHGGRTSHAAIVSRELGIPAVIGTGNATQVVESGAAITVSCASGESGEVLEGELEFEAQQIDTGHLPATRTDLMIILASPEAAFRWWNLPVDGVGLARMEFIINNIIQIHPLALTRFDELDDEQARQRIDYLTRAYGDKQTYFVENLARGVAKIAAAFHPKPVIVRLSDFKTNEYAGLIGGSQFEPTEQNPMIGFRGASRYRSEQYRDGFALECRAIQMARQQIGMSNVIIMVPFCRTIDEADAVLQTMAEHGLVRGKDGLKIYVMAEIPANIILADQFAHRFDGFSIGTNDLTQLTLGVDRDSQQLADLFDERNQAITRSVESLIRTAHEAGRPVGLCGQAPSDHPDFATFLVEQKIDSISVNPDRVVDVLHKVAEAEKRIDQT